jgi:hypothetical protein
MKITVLSKWFNEELLAPLFFKHYGYADEIRILLETDTSDRTREISKYYPWVKIIDVHNKFGYDDIENLVIFNRAILDIKDGWIITPLADEFIFPENFEDPRQFLSRQTDQVVKAIMFHVYKHVSEGPIDYNEEVIPQRVHGRMDKDLRDYLIKPIIFRASAKAVLGIGLHTLVGDYTYATERWVGAHWKMADREIAVRRRISNRNTFSERNHKKRYGRHDFHVTEPGIESELKAAENYPVLPLLVRP